MDQLFYKCHICNFKKPLRCLRSFKSSKQSHFSNVLRTQGARRQGLSNLKLLKVIAPEESLLTKP
jgi:hypothetical protein